LSIYITSRKKTFTRSIHPFFCIFILYPQLFRDGAPAGLMEQVTIALLRDLYETSDANESSNTNNGQSRSSTTKFIDSRDGEPEGKIKIHQINCWKNSLLVKIGRDFRTENGLKETIIEIFVAVTDQLSPHSVASDAMRSNMQKLVFTAKSYGKGGIILCWTPSKLVWLIVQMLNGKYLIAPTKVYCLKIFSLLRCVLSFHMKTSCLSGVFSSSTSMQC
jgi:hypothetical protein